MFTLSLHFPAVCYMGFVGMLGNYHTTDNSVIEKTEFLQLGI